MLVAALFVAAVCILTNLAVWALKQGFVWFARTVHGALHEEAAAYMAAQKAEQEESSAAAIGFTHEQDKEEE